jgi:hypothetical protein
LFAFTDTDNFASASNNLCPYHLQLNLAGKACLNLTFGHGHHQLNHTLLHCFLFFSLSHSQSCPFSTETKFCGGVLRVTRLMFITYAAWKPCSLKDGVKLSTQTLTCNLVSPLSVKEGLSYLFITVTYFLSFNLGGLTQTLNRAHHLLVGRQGRQVLSLIMGWRKA